MSHDGTQHTKLGPGFDVPYVSGAQPTGYSDDAEMEDTASSSVRFVGETIPESTVSSLGLPPSDVPTGESPRGVTGLRTAGTRIFGDADAGSTAHTTGGEHVSSPGVSGSQTVSDVPIQPTVPATSSRRSRSKSPLGRALSPKRTQSSELRMRFARLHQMRVSRFVQVPDRIPDAPVPHDSVSRREADAALAQLHKQISDATQRTEELLTAVEDTKKTAEAAGHIATQGASGVARTNQGLDQMVMELRNELQSMREKIEDAETRASAARSIADSAEQRANRAQYAADAAEQKANEAQHAADTAERRAANAQSDADRAKERQAVLEKELQNADTAFRNEKAERERLEAAAHADIGALRQELQSTKSQVERQEEVMANVAGMGQEMQTAKQDMEDQRLEMQKIGDVADDVMGHVEHLTATFNRIDEAQQRANVVNPPNVKSTPAHVQGTSANVNEPAGHVQTEPTPVIDLVSEDSKEKGTWKPESVAEYIERMVEERMEKVRAEKRLEKDQSVDLHPDESSTPWMTSSVTPTPFSVSKKSAEPSSEAAKKALHGMSLSQASSSQDAQQTGEPNRTPSMYDNKNTGTRKVVVDKPPSLPSGTQKAIEGIMKAYLEKIGFQQNPQEVGEVSRTEGGSTVGNLLNPDPETTQFSFQRMQDKVAPIQGQQVFATAQWRPKEPPMYTGAATDDVYLWTSLVKQYFVFMKGDAQQEVAFAATLLRGAAHEWYMGYEKRNGNRPARDWPTLMQAILERFGSNIREQEAHAKLLTISQGKRTVRDYTSEFETLLGRLSTRDESTWKRMYVWGLQPHLGKAVALKYPTSIAQAAGHAEEIELAIRASQRPNLNQQGARATVSYSARGGSSAAPRPFLQGRGRGNVGPVQRGGRGNGGRRGGGWIRGRQGGQQSATQAKSGTQCFNCGQYGHYASQCPKGTSTSGSSNTAQSVNQRSNIAQVRGQQRGGFRGNRRGGSGRRARFSGMNVIYDTEGNEYPVDENGNLVLEFIDDEDAATSQQNTEKQGN